MMPSIVSTAAMCSLGFDWLVVDLEHTAMSLGDAEQIFLTAEKYNVVPFARLPSADPFQARRLLDVGAQGLIIPVVQDPVAFKQFAAHCHYPPKGKRGLALSRANLWGEELTKYIQEFQPILIPQIETQAGIDALADILKVEGAEGAFIGPYDLSLDLGMPGDFNQPKFLAAIEKFKKTCQASKKVFGAHQVDPDYAALQKKIDEGNRLLVFGIDVMAIRKTFADLKKIKR